MKEQEGIKEPASAAAPCPCGDPNCSGPSEGDQLLDELLEAFFPKPTADDAKKTKQPVSWPESFDVAAELRKAERRVRIDKEVERRLRTDVRWSLMDGKVTAVILDDNGLDCFEVKQDARGIPQFALDTNRYDKSVAVTNEYDMPLLDAVLQAVKNNQMPTTFRPDGTVTTASSVKEGK